jgi:hypothetical protein
LTTPFLLKPDRDRKNLQRKTPTDLHRKEQWQQNFPENAFYPCYVGLNQPQSNGAGEYYYAPAEGNTNPGVPFSSSRIVTLKKITSGSAEPGRSATGDGVLHTTETGSPDQWNDSDLMVELGEDGYPRYDYDTNLARHPLTWRFPHNDKDVSMYPQENQTNMPQPPNAFDIGSESLVYPLQSGLSLEALAPFKPSPKAPKPEDFKWGEPQLSKKSKEDNATVDVFTVDVWRALAGKWSKTPFYLVVFALEKGADQKPVLSNNPEPQIVLNGKTEPIDIKAPANSVAAYVVKNIPASVIQKAASIFDQKPKVEKVVEKKEDGGDIEQSVLRLVWQRLQKEKVVALSEEKIPAELKKKLEANPNGESSAIKWTRWELNEKPSGKGWIFETKGKP